MPTFRPDLAQIPPYIVAASIDEPSNEFGIRDLVRLASNECPSEPFPEVKDAIAAAVAQVNRYPDNSYLQLATVLAERYAVSRGHIWVGAGTTQLLGCMAWATGGPDTTAVFAEPSFAMYPIYTALSGSTAISVPLNPGYQHDLNAMLGALRDDTTVVYVCNPNNPTGTHIPAYALSDFIAEVPERILVVIDEAYMEYATATDYASAAPLALERNNVVVTRTFSKIFGLAGLRIGYAIGHPRTLSRLRPVQLPFSVTHLAQVAAIAALGCEDQLRNRADQNAAEKARLETALADRDVSYVPTQTNFLFMNPTNPVALGKRLRDAGVVVRFTDRWLRVTVGTVDENRLFIEALDSVGA